MCLSVYVCVCVYVCMCICVYLYVLALATIQDYLQNRCIAIGGVCEVKTRLLKLSN